jgi:hypothetical protein
MKWSVVAPFFAEGEDNRWIDDFVSDPDLQFTKVLPEVAADHRWHSRSERETGLTGWMAYWRHSRIAFKLSDHDDGIITVFPQLAFTAALQKRLWRSKSPIIAWCFNIGAPPGPLKRVLGRWVFGAVDQFVVHSSREVALANRWFGLASDKVTFVPLQRGEMAIDAREEIDDPFIVSMGSANRDYRTLLEAVCGTGIPLTIVAAKRCVADLDLPNEVTWLHNLSHAECLDLAVRARISVIPLEDEEAASGQVTFLEAMRLGRPVIATRSPGTEDYITDGQTGVLVPKGDPQALRLAICSLWRNNQKRTALSNSAREYAAKHFSDEAVAIRLREILLTVANRAGVIEARPD